MEDQLTQWLFDPTIGRLVTVLIGIVILIVIVKILQRTVSRYVKESETRYRARKFVKFLGYIAGVLVIATVFSDKLGGLTVALGVAGAGIAFALQEVIASVAGWFALTFANFYKTGDRIQLGGIKGDVIDIGILRTTVMEVGDWVKGDLYNGRVVRIANSFVFKEPVFNYSGDFPFLWDELTIPVKYGSSEQRARKILQDVAHEVVGGYVEYAKSSWKDLVSKFMIENARVDPTVTLIANDNWMEFTLRYVVDYKERRGTKDKLFSRILEEVEKSKGKVVLASATFELVGLPPVQVHVGRGRPSSK